MCVKGGRGAEADLVPTNCENKPFALDKCPKEVYILGPLFYIYFGNYSEVVFFHYK